MKTLLNIAILALLAISSAAADVIGKSEKSALEFTRISVLSFAEDGVLLIGDGSRILAVNTGDTEKLSGEFTETKGFVANVAGRLGVVADDIEVVDLVVNPASGRLYFAVRKQDDKSYVIVRLAPGGEIEHFSMEDVEYAAVPLPRGVSNIQAICWVDGRLLASAGSNEEFGSKIFSADGPLNHGSGGSIYMAETYHIAHSRWETKAPMSVMVPYVEDGKQYVVGAFRCTPVVKYPVEAIENGAKIKGLSVIELGNGNQPLDMFKYEKDGEPQVLTSAFRRQHRKAPFGPTPHIAFRFDGQLLSTDKVNEEGLHRIEDAEELGDSVELSEPFFGVLQMDRLNETTAIALRETDGDAIDLVTIALP